MIDNHYYTQMIIENIGSHDTNSDIVFLSKKLTNNTYNCIFHNIKRNTQDEFKHTFRISFRNDKYNKQIKQQGGANRINRHYDKSKKYFNSDL